MGRNGSNCFVRLGLRSRGFKASILHLISVLGASWDFLDQIFASIDGYRRRGVGCVVDLTGDEDPTDEDGDIGVLVSLGDEIFLEGNKSQESNIGDSDNTGDGGKIAGRAIITWGGGIASLILKSEGTIVE
ncbi:hypothetical protein Tco_0505128 [Tanacetum coccineum]